MCAYAQLCTTVLPGTKKIGGGRKQMDKQYEAPQLSKIGSLSELTLSPANGGAYGKGSTSADGKSGLVGNRSGH